MTYHFVAKHRVEFYETDLAGIVHFSNFYRYMEKAEHEFFRSLGLQIHGAMPDGTVFGWPRVSATCSFKSPAYYGDEIEVGLTVQRLTRRSLTITYQFHREGTELALGEMKTAFCLVPPSGKLVSAEIPNADFDRLTMSPDA